MDRVRYDAGMFDGTSADEAWERIDEWERSLERRAEQARELARRTARLTATARSRDGLIEVTVGAEGRIENINLSEGIRRQAAEDTARTLMETLRAATTSLLEQFQAATADTVGIDRETGQMLVAGLKRRLGEPDDE